MRCGLRTADSDEHNYCRHSSTAQMGVSHARCCLLTLKDGSVVTSCSLHVLLSACGVCPGLCVLVREGNKNRQNLPVRPYRVRPHGENPGNRLIHSRKKKKLWAPATRATVLGSSSNLDQRVRKGFPYRRSFRILPKSA